MLSPDSPKPKPATAAATLEARAEPPERYHLLPTSYRVCQLAAEGLRFSMKLVSKTKQRFTCLKTQGWFRAGVGLVYGWFRVGLGLVYVGLGLVEGWFRVGLGLVYGWFRAGLGWFRVGSGWFKVGLGLV